MIRPRPDGDDRSGRTSPARSPVTGGAGAIERALLDTGGVAGHTAGIDVRRYLIDAAGPPLAPEVIAAATVRAMRRDPALCRAGTRPRGVPRPAAPHVVATATAVQRAPGVAP
jgi:hypothetical protein